MDGFDTPLYADVIEDAAVTRDKKHKPSIAKETIEVKWHSEENLEKLRADFREIAPQFMEKNLATFLHNTNTLIYGKHANNRAFRNQVGRLAQKDQWVVHLIVPLEIGGSTAPSNLVIIPRWLDKMWQNEKTVQIEDLRTEAEEIADEHDRRKKWNLPGGDEQIPPLTTTIDRPLYSVFLPHIMNVLCMPLVNDDGQLVDVPLPLDLHSGERLRRMGFRTLRRTLSAHKKRIQLLRGDGQAEQALQQDYKGVIDSPNRMKRVNYIIGTDPESIHEALALITEHTPRAAHAEPHPVGASVRTSKAISLKDAVEIDKREKMRRLETRLADARRQTEKDQTLAANKKQIVKRAIIALEKFEERRRLHRLGNAARAIANRKFAAYLASPEGQAAETVAGEKYKKLLASKKKKLESLQRRAKESDSLVREDMRIADKAAAELSRYNRANNVNSIPAPAPVLEPFTQSATETVQLELLKRKATQKILAEAAQAAAEVAGRKAVMAVHATEALTSARGNGRYKANELAIKQAKETAARQQAHAAELKARHAGELSMQAMMSYAGYRMEHAVIAVWTEEGIAAGDKPLLALAARAGKEASYRASKQIIVKKGAPAASRPAVADDIAMFVNGMRPAQTVLPASGTAIARLDA